MRKLDRKIKAELMLESSNPPFQFWGFSVSIVSICYACFYFFHPGLLNELLLSKIEILHETYLLVPLLGFGVIKVFGILFDNAVLKAVGIIGLSTIWSIIFLFFFVFSFGVGYPTSRFITTFFIMLACWRVSFKGGAE